MSDLLACECIPILADGWEHRGSGLGRIVAGPVSDHLGRYNTLIMLLVLSILVIFALWLPVTVDTVGLYYVSGFFLGCGTASVISVAPVCFGQ